MNVNQIYGIVNDTAADVLGKYAPRVKDTASFVSLGKQLSDMKLLDPFYGALASRITKTVVFVRSYERASRRVISDIQSFGAFVQKVYTDAPVSASSNPVWSLSNGSNPPTITPASPYDISTTVNVTTLLYGEKGTWAVEIVKPTKQIKGSFLDEASMAAFIDGINLTVENSYEIYAEGLENLAVATAIANAIENGCATDVLQVYNNSGVGVSLTASVALASPDFLATLAESVKNKLPYLKKPSTKHNPAGYMTFTPEDAMITEVLTPVMTAIDVKLKATSYHDDLVSLPGFSEIPYWQSPGTSDAFEDCSTIDIKHVDIKNNGATPPVAVEIKKKYILAVVRDEEACKAYFGDRDTWELPNPRQKSIVHGEDCETGYAVDSHANIWVFYMGE